MNTYFKLSGKGFNSNSGDCKIDGKSFLYESIKSTKKLPEGAVCKACKAKANSYTFWGAYMFLSISFIFVKSMSWLNVMFNLFS
jgi:hypothetical protein